MCCVRWLKEIRKYLSRPPAEVKLTWVWPLIYLLPPRKVLVRFLKTVFFTFLLWLWPLCTSVKSQESRLIYKIRVFRPMPRATGRTRITWQPVARDTLLLLCAVKAVALSRSSDDGYGEVSVHLIGWASEAILISDNETYFCLFVLM